MLIDMAAKHRLELASSFMVGDRWRDIEAGQRAGCTTLLVRQTDDTEVHVVQPNYEINDLCAAAQVILGSREGVGREALRR
jgi:D-glycero-D-manno-heptose 1,7-bisphosphate phosphatase